jgi:hypothetical protein
MGFVVNLLSLFYADSSRSVKNSPVTRGDKLAENMLCDVGLQSCWGLVKDGYYRITIIIGIVLKIKIIVSGTRVPVNIWSNAYYYFMPNSF